MIKNLPEAVLPFIEAHRQQNKIDAESVFGTSKWADFLHGLLDGTEEKTLLAIRTFAVLLEHGFFTNYPGFDCMRPELRSVLCAEERAFLLKELATADTHEKLIDLICRGRWEKLGLKAIVADTLTTTHILPSTWVGRLTSQSRLLYSRNQLLFIAAYWNSLNEPFAEWLNAFTQLHPHTTGGDGRHDRGSPELCLLAEIAMQKMHACVREETIFSNRVHTR